MLKGSCFHPEGTHIPKKSSLSVTTRDQTRTASLCCLRFVRRFAPKNPRAGKRGLFRLADPKMLRRFAPHCVPTREDSFAQLIPRSCVASLLNCSHAGSSGTASKLKPVVRCMRDALSASLAGHAMSVTSDGMSLVGRNMEFGRFPEVRAIPRPLSPSPQPVHNLEVLVFETMLNRRSRIWYLNVFLLALSRFFLNLTNCSAGSLISVTGKVIPSSARLRPIIIYLARPVYVVWYMFRVLQYLGTTAFSIDNDVVNISRGLQVYQNF